jgi:CBS domain-containing protein
MSGCLERKGSMMKIADIPEFKDKKNVFHMAEDVPLQHVVEAMAQKNYGCVVVTRNKKVVGIFTERDLMRRVVAERKEVSKLSLGDVMTKDPHVAYLQDDVNDSMRRMSQGRFRHLPIIDEEQNLVGLLSQGDFVAYTWVDILNRITKRTATSFFSNTQLWMLILGPLVYLLVLKYFVLSY